MRVLAFGCGAARPGTAPEATPSDRAERFYGDRRRARPGVSMTSGRRNGRHRKSPVARAFSVAGL